MGKWKRSLVCVKEFLDFYLAAAVSTGNGCDFQLAQSNPLSQVVGETGPEHFHLRFGQAAQVELAQSQFAFDPGVAELDHALRRRYCFWASGVAILWAQSGECGKSMRSSSGHPTMSSFGGTAGPSGLGRSGRLI